MPVRLVEEIVRPVASARPVIAVSDREPFDLKTN
jgi:hypothetical protein